MTTENRTIEAGFNHLLENNQQKLIFGAMKKANVRPFMVFFDDFLQEAHLTYAETYVKYPHNIEENLKKFNVYVYQAIYWRMINLLVQQSRQNNHFDHTAEDETIINHPNLADNKSLADRLVTDELFAAIFKICTKAEQRFLIDAYVNELSGSEIAKKQKISRAAVSKMRKKVGLKALLVMDKN